MCIVFEGDFGVFGDFGVTYATPPHFGDFGDFGVSFAATVAWRYTRRGDPRLSVQGEPLLAGGDFDVLFAATVAGLNRGVTQGGGNYM